MLDRRTVGAALAPLAFIGLLAAPLQLEPRAHRLVAIFAAVMIAWVCEVVPIAVTALAIGPLLVVMDVTDAATAFRYYGDPLLFLFIGGFMLAEAMRRHGLDRRFAHAVVSLPFVRGSAWRTQVAIVCAAALMSMWISNTATCAIFVPLLLGTSGLAKLPKEGASRDPATGPLLALAYVCSTGGLGTPLGSPPNLITIRLLESAGVQLGFVEWLAIGVPSAIVLSIVAAVITMRNGRGDEPVDGEQLVEPSARWSRGERVTAVCFAAAVIGWALPAVVEATGASIAGALNRSMHVGAVAILACIPLFVLRDPSRRDTATGEMPSMLPWSSAVKIDWGVILLFGGGISLGTQLEETGLAGAIAEAAVLAIGATDVWTLSAIACAATIVMSEIASNTAAANMLVPLVIALAQENGVSPIPPALSVGVGASVGFMLPIATAPNAIVYSTGRVPQVAMMRSGILLDVACFGLVVLLVRLICPLMGWS